MGIRVRSAVTVYGAITGMQLCSARICVSVETMSTHARTCFRGYRYYGFPYGSPGPAARV